VSMSRLFDVVGSGQGLGPFFVSLSDMTYKICYVK
jgi:hypothetical protein